MKVKMVKTVKTITKKSVHNSWHFIIKQFIADILLLPHICTGWRKKNPCFSSNCNFVYFQFKKITSTPKQPVINAVLITYIDYSIT